MKAKDKFTALGFFTKYLNNISKKLTGSTNERKNRNRKRGK